MDATGLMAQNTFYNSAVSGMPINSTVAGFPNRIDNMIKISKRRDENSFLEEMDLFGSKDMK